MIAGYSFGQLVVAVIVIAAIVAVMYVALNKFGVRIPDWVVQIFWIVVVAVIAIAAVRFLLSL